MKYRRMPIEEESPEQLGYGSIRFNLAESSVSDRYLSELGVDLDGLLLQYGDHLGDPELRRELAAQGAGLAPDDVLVTTGAAGALFIVASSLLQAGDHLIVARPNYATNLETPQAIGCDLSALEMTFENGFRLDFDRLEAMIRPETKLVSVTSPHNPSGSQLSVGELTRLVELVEERGCYLLFDETYRDLAFEEPLPVGASLSPRVISVSSLSKAYGIPGIRVGWLKTKNRELQHLFLCAKEQIGICGSVLDEAVALAVVRSRPGWRQEVMKRVSRAFGVVQRWMQAEERLEWIEPQGGAVCFPRIRPAAGIDVDTFYRHLFEARGTYVGPGHWFGFPRSYFRLGYAWPTPAELDGGLRGISSALSAAEGG